MMETREMGRLYMKAAGNAVATIADHNRKSMQLSGTSALRSFEYLARLAGAKTGIEAIEVSGAHYRNQLSALGEYTDNLVDLARRMRTICLDPSEPGIVASFVVPCRAMQNPRLPSLGGRYGRSISSNHHRAARLCAS
jgi:hypothetical protein